MAGYTGPPVDGTDKWPAVTEFNALGHALAANCSIAPCQNKVPRHAHCVYFANINEFADKPEHVVCRKPMQQICKPALNFRFPTWNFQEFGARKIQRLQNRLLALSLGAAKNQTSRTLSLLDGEDGKQARQPPA